MPVTKSAIKRVRQNIKQRTANVRVKKEVRLAVKQLRKAIEAKDVKKLQELLSEAYSQLDRAVKKNLYHKNKAARIKAQLSKLVKANAPVSAKAATKKAAPTTKKAPAKKAPAKPAAKKPATKPAAKKAAPKKK